MNGNGGLLPTIEPLDQADLSFPQDLGVLKGT
jgi:hypothetical protein